MVKRLPCLSIVTILAIAVLGLVPAPPAAGATATPIPVVVTIPVLKDLVEQIGGSHVRVTSLLSGYENEHTYSPKPSDLIAVRHAAVLFEVGLGLEVWVSSLVKNAGSPSLRVVTTSTGIDVIHDDADRDHADPHHGNHGNPHVWMDPDSAVLMVAQITDTLSAVDPAHAQDFQARQTVYRRQLEALRNELVARVRALPDRRVIVHHPAWPYMARRFGFEIAGVSQTQSGTEPSARQLHTLVSLMKREQIKVIASEVQLSHKIPSMLAKETGARVVVLTTLPGGVPNTETYLDMLRYNVFQLVRALETP